MNGLEIYRRLSDLETPVFTNDQLEAVFGKNSRATTVKLNRLVGKGVLIRVIQGMYSLPNTDPLCIASSIETPSFISLWAALRYHGLTTQSPMIINVINTNRSGSITLNHQDGKFEIIFIKTTPDRLFGQIKENIGGHSCFMADPERTVIDCLLHSGYIPLDEVINAINEDMDPVKMIDYSVRIGKQSLMKRVCYILDSKGFDIGPEMFGNLSSTYVRLDPSGERKGRYNSKWHILQNGVEL